MKAKTNIALSLLLTSVIGFGFLVAKNSKKGIAETRATEETIQTNFKLDWDARTELTPGGSDYKDYKYFSASGADDVAIESRVAGTPLFFYDAVNNTFEQHNQEFQAIPYSAYKSFSIRNYHALGTSYYGYFGYANKYEGDGTDSAHAHRFYGTVLELAPLPTNTGRAIKSVTMKLNQSCSYLPYYFWISDDGTNWTGTLSDDYRMTYDSSTKTFSLALTKPTLYVRIYRYNYSQASRVQEPINYISITHDVSADIHVTFNSEGGSSVGDQWLFNGDKIVEPTAPTKQHDSTYRYEFDSWWTTADNSGIQWDFNNDTVSSDVELHAHWTATPIVDHIISFESNGGSSVADVRVNIGEKAVAPANPTKATSDDTRYQFTFGGWFEDADLKTAFDWDNTIIDDDITLYAKWTFAARNTAPAGSHKYQINKDGSVWAGAWTNDTYYQDATMNSRETFDRAASKPEVSLHVSTEIASHAGFKVHNTYSQLVRNTDMFLTFTDKTKVLTYVRLDVGNWGETAVNMSMYANDSVVAADTQVAPNPVEKTHFLQQTFNASDRVTSIKFSFGDHDLAINYLYLAFEEDPLYTAAYAYAEDFNDANVCGLTDDAGLDATAWNDQRTAYLALDEDVRHYLTMCTISEGEIGEMLERYDRVVTLHGESYDFMGRIAAGLIGGSHVTHKIAPITQSSLAFIVVLGAVIVSISVVGYCLLKRKSDKQ